MSTRYLISVGLIMSVLLLVAVVLLPGFGWAFTANCPSEPASNTPIGDGEVFSGTNCNLYTDGDVDSYTFTATTGNTYHLAAALNGAFAANICLTLYGPNGAPIFPTGTPAPGNGCTYVGYQFPESSVVTDQKLTATGTYTVAITQVAGSSGKQNYAVSLERLYPFPPNAQAVPKLGQALAGDITPLSDSNAFAFGSVATTGTYQVAATLPSNASQNICLTLYNPNGVQIYPAGAPVPGNGCTSVGYQFPEYSVITQFTPSLKGTYLAFLQEFGNDATVSSYSLEVSCLVGTCPPFIPPQAPALYSGRHRHLQHDHPHPDNGLHHWEQ